MARSALAALLMIGLLALSPARAFAAAPERKVLVVEGAEGVWLRQDVADRLLGDFKAAREQVELLGQRVSLLEQKLSIREDELALNRRLRELADRGEQKAVGVLDQAVAATKQCEADRDAWHRSRGLWFGLGAAVLLVVVAGGAIAWGRR